MAQQKSNNGAVMVYVASPTRVALIKEPQFKDALWKLPGGGIEDFETVTQAAWREAREEVGIDLNPDSFRVVSEQRRGNDGYYPYACVVEVSEETFDGISSVGNENGRRIQIGKFRRKEVRGMMVDFLDRHRPLVLAAEEYLVAQN